MRILFLAWSMAFLDVLGAVLAWVVGTILAAGALAGAGTAIAVFVTSFFGARLEAEVFQDGPYELHAGGVGSPARGSDGRPYAYARIGLRVVVHNVGHKTARGVKVRVLPRAHEDFDGGLWYDPEPSQARSISAGESLERRLAIHYGTRRHLEIPVPHEYVLDISACGKNGVPALTSVYVAFRPEAYRVTPKTEPLTVWTTWKARVVARGKQSKRPRFQHWARLGFRRWKLSDALVSALEQQRLDPR